MARKNMFSSDWYRMQFQNEINSLLSSGAGKRAGRSEMPDLFQPSKKKNKNKKFKNGMPEGLENDSQSNENTHWNEASGEWTDEPQETFVQMTLQDLLESSEDEEVPAARQQQLLEIDAGEEIPQPKKQKRRGKKARAVKQQQEPQQQLRTNTAQQQMIKKHRPEKSPAGAYTKSAEELQEIILWSEILGEPAAVRRRKRKVNQYYGDQGHAYRR